MEMKGKKRAATASIPLLLVAGSSGAATTVSKQDFGNTKRGWLSS
jgi:hypothetical protein